MTDQDRLRKDYERDSYGYSKFLNRCRADIGHNNFIIDKKYRGTLLMALRSYEGYDSSLSRQLEISDLFGLLEKRT